MVMYSKIRAAMFIVLFYSKNQLVPEEQRSPALTCWISNYSEMLPPQSLQCDQHMWR